jgi:hypothetical protein
MLSSLSNEDSVSLVGAGITSKVREFMRTHSTALEQHMATQTSSSRFEPIESLLTALILASPTGREAHDQSLREELALNILEHADSVTSEFSWFIDGCGGQDCGPALEFLKILKALAEVKQVPELTQFLSKVAELSSYGRENVDLSDALSAMTFATFNYFSGRGPESIIYETLKDALVLVQYAEAELLLHLSV